nr:STY4851/ECs_5259 family protein [Hephaestia sp. MAHUQ-44]
MRLVTISRLVVAKAAQGWIRSAPRHPAPVASWLTDLSIEAIDGRPLYRYGISEDGFRALKERLCERRAALSVAPSRDLAGQFVLWAAEWFRRCYNGTGLNWEALNAELGAPCEWRHWRDLTDEGMRFWRLEPLRLNGTHHRLAAIARQGGFPVAALERTQGGWAQRYLETLVGTLAANPLPDFDAAKAVAERLIEMVPPTWQNEGMRIVSAELATEVVRLRQLAEADGVPAGALVSPWLDEHLPGWRDELPLSVGSEAGRTLIDGLMRTVVLRGGYDAVKCYRWLEIGPDGRQEGITLELAGLLDGKAIPGNLAADWSRLRLYPSGSFAQHVVGELAVADPDEDGAWRARPSIHRTDFAVPASVPIAAELRGDGQRVGMPFVMAGGDAVTGDLRVYVIECETEEAIRLRQIGSASGAFRDEALVVDTPASWSVEAHGDGAACEPFTAGKSAERTMAKVSGAAVVTNARGDCYLLRAGQKAATRDRLIVHASNCSFGLADPTSVLIVGKPSALVEERARSRSAGRDELFWRPAGTSGWRPGVSGAELGRCEFAWRDQRTGHIRDRRDVVVLPDGFDVRHAVVGNQQEISIVGWLDGASAHDGIPHGPKCWRLHAKGDTRSRFVVTLRTAGGDAFDIVIPLRHQAWIESWTEGPTRQGARLSLSVINRYVARTAQRCELMADLLDENRRPVPQGHVRWWVDGEMPLSTVRDDLAALLRPSGKLRTTIQLNFNDANEDYWFVGEFEHELSDERGGLVPNPAVAEEGARIVRRAIHDPTREHDLGRYDLLDSINHHPIVLPRQYGDALIYLRADDRVLSAPRLMAGLIDNQAQNPLGRAMSVAAKSDRQAALELLFSQAAAEPTSGSARALIRQLIDLTLSLDGLPPGTFDALLLLPQYPEIATLMLFQARRDELEPLLRLAEGLPFAWWLVPKMHWNAAAKAQADYLFDRLPDEFQLVAGTIGETRTELSLLEPILAPLLEQSVPKCPLDVAVNSFLNRSGDRIAAKNPNPFRSRHDSDLPAWRYDEQFWRSLDAPLVAALAARGKTELDAPELMAVKDIARRHPHWFREGFAAALKEM